MGDTIKEGTKAFFMFGRFNPPTIGHGRSIDRLIELAAGADAYVFVTSTQDPIKNPLSVSEKVEILKKMFPNPEIVRIINTTTQHCKTIFTCIHALKDRGYTDITFVGGSDRVKNFEGKLPIPVISSGERDADSNTGDFKISATEMRRAARANNWNTFRALTNSKITNSNARKTMANIKSAMEVVKKASKSASVSRKSVKASAKPKNSTRSSRRR